MIDISDVTRIFAGTVLALDSVSLSIEAGEFVTLLGPSGCGKTTLLRLLAGFDTPTKGKILLNDADVTDVPPYDRDVNMVFQDYALFPHLSVGRNVAFGLERLKWPKAKVATAVRDALDMVELADKIDRMPHELSGGQRQRVALARALARGPKVLLLDEPLSALDAGLREAMQVELKRLHNKLGITFVMVTHDQTEALAMSDRIVLMLDGRVAQVGTPDELYNAPASPYVASFIGTTNLFDGQVIDSSAAELLVETGAGRLHCAPRTDIARGASVRVGMRPEHLRLAADSEASAVNTLPCRIEDALFHGSLTRFRCATGTTTEQIYWDWQKSAHPDDSIRPTEGSTVHLYAPPADMFVFPQEGAR
uniref:Spermidine/putrescine import ATP-binding protein PotA n=1 Tax=Ruegeria sp. PR1b TaxID=185588 RepID=Q8KVX6_9RHOB|nr:ABC transporter ATP-binding protein [Ruegeria sp. PR1b]AAN05287.1 RC214 [Ruegeria sp. PR1b]